MRLEEIFKGPAYIKEASLRIDSNLLPMQYFSIAGKIIRREEKEKRPKIVSIYGPRYSGKTSTLVSILKEARTSGKIPRKTYYADTSTKAYSIALENPRDFRDSIFSEEPQDTILGFDDILSEDFYRVKKFIESYVTAYRGSVVLIVTGSDQPKIREIVEDIKHIHIGISLGSPNTVILPRPFVTYLERTKNMFLAMPRDKKRLFYRYRRRKYIVMRPYMHLLSDSETKDFKSASREIDEYLGSPKSNAEKLAEEYDKYRRYGSFPGALIDKELIEKASDMLARKFEEYFGSLPEEEYEALERICENLFRPIKAEEIDKEILESLFSRYLVIPIRKLEGELYEEMERIKEERMQREFIPIPIDPVVLRGLREVCDVYSKELTSYYDLIAIVKNLLNVVSTDPRFHSYEMMTRPPEFPIFYKEIDDIPVFIAEFPPLPHRLKMIIAYFPEDLDLNINQGSEESFDKINMYRSKLEEIALFGLSNAAAPIVIHSPIATSKKYYRYMQYVPLYLEPSEEEIEGLEKSRKRIATYSSPPKSVNVRGVRISPPRALFSLLVLPTRTRKSS